MSSCQWGDRKRPAVPCATPDKSSKPKKTKNNGHSYRVKSLIEAGTDPSMMFVRYNDEVHRSIDFCPLMQKIMDTWPVQRLRDIKQLGTSYLVYACANHTRFEHSVGVAFLAQGMCRRLQSKYRIFGVTDKDVLCVTLAGLLHDVGHGPFSHLYEAFRGEMKSELERDPELRERYASFPEVPTEWSHEQSSLMMVDAALESLGLKIDMREENLDKPLLQIGDGVDAHSIRCYWSDSAEENDCLTNRDWIFIKECIYGAALPEVAEKLGMHTRIGRRDPKLEWLYDIVSNRHNGIDVDKVDYFARDERRTMGEAGNVDISIINEACIARAKCADHASCPVCQSEAEGHYQICYPEKCVSRVIEFYKTRGRLHEHIYQHKTTTASGCMLVDILKRADPYYLIPTGDDQVRLPISRAFYDFHSFDRLRDSIIDGILLTTTDELKPARDLAKRFVRRDLYKLGGEKVLHSNNKKHQDLWKTAKKHPDKIVRDICSVKPRHDNMILTEEDVIVTCCGWHQGKKDKNPLSFVRFVKKSTPTFVKTKFDCPTAHEIGDEDYRMSTTREFEKRAVRVFVRDPAKKALLSHAFDAYWLRYMEGSLVNGVPAPTVDFCGLQELEEGEGSDVDSTEEFNRHRSMDPVQLTQESGDEGDGMSPSKSPRGHRLEFPSPEPILRRL